MGLVVWGFLGAFVEVFCVFSFLLLLAYAMSVWLLVIWLQVLCGAGVSDHLWTYSLVFLLVIQFSFSLCFGPHFICLVGRYLFAI